MESRNYSPRIKDVSWGRLEVEGKAEPYKDAKLFPGGDAGFFKAKANCRARVANPRSRGALQQARGKRVGRRPVPYDMLSSPACVENSRNSLRSVL